MAQAILDEQPEIGPCFFTGRRGKDSHFSGVGFECLANSKFVDAQKQTAARRMTSIRNCCAERPLSSEADGEV
jgi:hypothetical protein